MKNVLRISALLTAALMVFIMVGCGGDDSEDNKDKTAPTMVSSTPATGGSIAANGTISMTFSEAMKEVTVAGAAGTVALGADGKTAVFTPSGAMPTGNVTLTVGGSDKAGNALTAATIALTVKAADNTPPDIDAAKCVPANGATGVDPATVTKMTVTFTEAMSEAKIDSFEPADAKVQGELAGDGMSLVISFLGKYTLGNEMEVKATISGKDLAGNALKTTAYGFATMKKEE